ncbi:hypothetical protein MJO28_009998 [Puccinia striiformis f. sp. tritici]|uniref:Uncharacterized protein n=1 Tax=Puccinia striiformis f. sp. tritici TaxID=168172 RepID=A0ACC0E8L1_9BASI|nr:hypothetical protein Pst134EA_017184 [Puccinia striiformis f. sp. tritici]KAH9450576.1 hypothetical protein Pst134EB_018106 [Puccinia striiformis f. sp. tritici]KAH9460873.1 hypothetical protein Pst134EA_017184 [Puccinia striiformis f. sp. tritici]KAI7948090.1 hypothetical protein MJO28_009998 [Puccinia striiformis f. sp. tritici]
MWRGRFDSIFSVFTFAAVLAILCGGIQSFQDAPFKRPESVYRDAMVCPRGISNKTGGIIFLVHGAATTGAKTWGEGPFNERLANYGPEYDVCWVNLPWNGLGDLQQSAEYVAYGIKHFASLSHASGNKINVIAHSQGAGANVQWALTFWPSLKPLVLNFFAIAGTFKGAMEAYPMCLVENLWGGCMPSPLQLKPNSKYMKAQNSESDEYSGANAQVKTISIFSIYDQVVQWEGSKGKASYLKGATMLSLQSEKLCGKGHIVGHLGIAEDLATLKIIQAIIPPSNPISNELDNFDKSSCRHLGGLWLKLISRWTYVLNVGMNFAVGPARMHKLFNEFAHLRVAKEPGLQSYVCERGYATDCLPSNATFADLRE